MLLDVRLLFIVANVVSGSGRGGGGWPALLIAFVLVYYVQHVSFVVSLLPQLRWLIALMTCNIEHDSGQTVGDCPPSLLLLPQVALCQCQMLILIMPTDLTSGNRIQSITVKYVHTQKSHENRISRVKFEEKQIRVHKKHKTEIE